MNVDPSVYAESKQSVDQEWFVDKGILAQAMRRSNGCSMSVPAKDCNSVVCGSKELRVEERTVSGKRQD